MVGHVDRYFVVLPDDSRAGGVADHVPAGAVQRYDHPSGRPWLLVAAPADEVTVVEAGTARLAVIGRCPVDTDRLREECARLTDLARLDVVTRTWPGSFHLVAAVDGKVRVQGSASGVRRVFHAQCDGVPVAASRSDVLGRMLGGDIDRAVLAARLLDVVPYPLTERSVWRGVDTVPPDHYLLLRGTQAHVARWWRIPEPELGLAEGARGLRTALEEAVYARTMAGGVVSADLSGGLDSTPLCMLAAPGPAKLVACTMASADPADDDLHWAKLAIDRLPGVEHVLFGHDEIPEVFAGLGNAEHLLDEPSMAADGAPRHWARLALVAARGSRVHLDGLGGDQVLSGHPAYYHDLLRRRPVLAARWLRVLRPLTGFPPTAATRTLADRGPYRDYLARTRRALLTGQASGHLPQFDWDATPSVAPWLTGEARRLITGQLAVESAEPLHHNRGRHADLQGIRQAAATVRALQQMCPAGAPPSESPFLDDRVVEACLRVRPEERITPFEFKPLMKAAMADLLGEQLTRRRTKGDGSTLAAEGFERNRRELLDMWDGSALVDLGLVDPEAVRTVLRTPFSHDIHGLSLSVALTTEQWLRARDRLTEAR